MEQETDLQKAEQFKTEGNKAYSAKTYATAIELYTQAIQFNKEDSSYYANRAACWLSLKRFTKCIDDCNSAIGIDNLYTKAFRRKAQSLLQLGKFDEAQLNFEKAIGLEKDQNIIKELNDTKILKQQYKDLEKSMEKESYTEASQIASQMLQKVPDYQNIQMRYVEILAKLGFTERAQETYFKYKNSWENVGPDVFYLAGLIELYGGNTEKAKKYFQEGMRLDPDNKKCMLALKKAKKCEELKGIDIKYIQFKEKGNTALKENKFEECVQHYEEALNLDKSNKKLNAVIYANRALVYLKQKDYDKAVDDCNSSIELNDKYYKSYLRRAEARKEQGNFEACIADYQKVKEVDPNQDVRGLIKEAKLAAQQAKKKDYYGDLGVTKDATDAEIKKSYRKLALLWHPDRHKQSDEPTKKEAEKKFRQISEAYTVLSDPKKRQMVDQGIDPEDRGGGHEGFSGVDPNQIFSMFFGGGGGHQQSHGFPDGGQYSFRFQ